MLDRTLFIGSCSICAIWKPSVSITVSSALISSAFSRICCLSYLTEESSCFTVYSRVKVPFILSTRCRSIWLSFLISFSRTLISFSESSSFML